MTFSWILNNTFLARSQHLASMSIFLNLMAASDTLDHLTLLFKLHRVTVFGIIGDGCVEPFLSCCFAMLNYRFKSWEFLLTGNAFQESILSTILLSPLILWVLWSTIRVSSIIIILMFNLLVFCRTWWQCMFNCNRPSYRCFSLGCPSNTI